MIRILVVEDSPTQRFLVRSVLEYDPEMQVIGEARNGEEAVALCHELEPDVITMDIRMPRLDGFEATRRIMEESPRPIVVLTSYLSDPDLENAYKAIEAGALMVMQKPVGLPDEDPEAAQVISTVKAMAGVRVVGRRLGRRMASSPGHAPSAMGEERKRGVPPRTSLRAIAIGASTGGPLALQQILGALQPAFPTPLLIVQHISAGFVESLARWLHETTPLQVRIPETGEKVQPGVAYLAPDGVHMQVSARGQIVLIPGEKVDGHCPSISMLFHSVAQTYGCHAIGLLLTGMGEDGARGLAAIQRAGGQTFVQDEGSSVVFGMGAAAVRLAVVDEVLPLRDIGPRLAGLAVAGSGPLTLESEEES